MKFFTHLLSRFSIGQQFILLGILGVLMPIMAIGLSLQTSYVLSMQNKQEQTKSLVEAAVSSTENYVALAKQGKMSVADAQAQALAALHAARFNNGDYYFALNYEGVTLFLSPQQYAATMKEVLKNPQMNTTGSSVLNAAIAGKPIFITYYYTKPGTTELVKKISYAEAVPEWKWVIGTGLYLDDLKREAIDQMIALAWIFIPTLIGFVAVIVLMRSTYNLTMSRHMTAQLLETKNAILSEMSATDWLTGTANRRSFDAHLTLGLTRVEQTKTNLALVMLDVDHFKSYNDFHGHPAGDARLRELTELMGAQLRNGLDLLARYGGEEFAVIMSHIEYDEAKAVAERIRQAVEDAQIPHGGPGAGAFITISVGLAMAKPGYGVTEAKLIDEADEALYRAKHAGRNNVCVAAS
jgi:diguanylate cyclase (GGDEF)-like protein